jgi:hypothetical protein
MRLDHLKSTQRGDLVYYLENCEELCEKYWPCHLIIKDKAVLGAYERWSVALEETIKTHRPSTFILQEYAKPRDELLAERLGYHYSPHETA